MVAFDHPILNPRHAWRAAVFALLASASAATAQETDLRQCLSIRDIQERVRCYDALAEAQVRSAPPPAEPQAPATVPQASVPGPPTSPSARQAVAPGTPRAEFGRSAAQREEQLPDEQRQLDRVTGVIAAARVVGAGYWEFTMADGSVWRVTEVRRAFRPPRRGDEVEIRRGSLGSYYLDAGGQPTIRIQRVD